MKIRLRIGGGETPRGSAPPVAWEKKAKGLEKVETTADFHAAILLPVFSRLKEIHPNIHVGEDSGYALD